MTHYNSRLYKKQYNIVIALSETTDDTPKFSFLLFNSYHVCIVQMHYAHDDYRTKENIIEIT